MVSSFFLKKYTSGLSRPEGRLFSSFYLSPAPHALPQAAGFSSGLSDAPHAAGLSDAPQAAGLSGAPHAAGLSAAPHALAAASLFQASMLDSAILFPPFS